MKDVYTPHLPSTGLPLQAFDVAEYPRKRGVALWRIGLEFAVISAVFGGIVWGLVR